MAELTDSEVMELDDEAFEDAQAMSDEAAEHTQNEEVVEETTTEVIEEITEEIANSDGEETEPEEEPEEVVETENDSSADNENEEDSEVEESPETTEQENVEFNYETSYNDIMKPLNVSGKEVQVKSIDDLRNLANMGIDYSRKMRDMKPLRTIGETLAKAGILIDGQVDERALTRLIDINSGNKDAIAELLKEQGIDPLDMETEDINYVAETSMVSEGTIAIQDVETELNNRGGLNAVVDAVGKLDTKSKQFFNETPQHLLSLQEDIASGVYNEIMGVVEYEKSLNRLGGLSDMEAYVQIAQAKQPAQQEVPKAPQVPKPSKDKRKAAGISNRAPVKPNKQAYDFLNMSDDEFEKLTPDTQSVY